MLFVSHSTGLADLDRFCKSTFEALMHKSVLVVADNPEHAALLTLTLRRSGYAITQVERWSDLSAGNFDLVVVDIDPTVGHGLDLARHLRESNVHAPLIAVSDSLYLSKHKVSLSNFDCYITKPWQPYELVEAAYMLTEKMPQPVL